MENSKKYIDPNANTLIVSLIQTSLHWQRPTANRAMLEEKIWQINQKTDLIILPEMFTTGFSMDAPRDAEPMNLHTFKWLKQMAAQTQAAIMGSYIVKEEKHYYNRLVFMQPDGNYHTYDKRHLFRMANEHKTYSAGSQKTIINWKGWNILPLVCYDLRFPVWSRNVNLAYDLLIYVANWPAPRRTAWNTLLAARAIENLCYTIGVNRVGQDDNNIVYAGDSSIIDYKGNALFHKETNEIIYTASIALHELRQYREKFPANLDADDFEIKI